jgi:hypothetical protein
MKSINLMPALTALTLCIAAPALAQTAAPTYIEGNQIKPADGIFVIDKSGNPFGTSVNPFNTYDSHTATIAAAINAPLNAQTTHGVNVGGVEGTTTTGAPSSYPITVQPQSTGFAVTASGAVTVATNSAGAVNLVQSDSSAAINVSTATTTQIVALSSGKSIYVSGWDIVVAAADNITLEYGTGTNCGTGTTALTGAYNFAANGGLATGSGLGVLFKLPASNALCVVTGAAVQASGRVSYAQF